MSCVCVCIRLREWPCEGDGIGGKSLKNGHCNFVSQISMLDHNKSLYLSCTVSHQGKLVLATMKTYIKPCSTHFFFESPKKPVWGFPNTKCIGDKTVTYILNFLWSLFQYPWNFIGIVLFPMKFWNDHINVMVPLSQLNGPLSVKQGSNILKNPRIMFAQ